MDTAAGNIQTLPLTYAIHRSSRLSLFAKRLFDVLAAFLGLLALSPLFALVATRLKRESTGPVFYRGRRMGLGGKEFGILKFRTMYDEAASYDGPRITAHDDARVTSLGRWLRDTKLNELPQLWNVLKGEMSLVGPRPEDPDIARMWPPQVFDEVLSVRPGITSPASVLYRDEEGLLTSASAMSDYVRELLPAKLRLDELYVRNRNFVLDLDVIFSTLLVLVPGIRQMAVPTESLFNGFLSRVLRRYVSWLLIDVLTALLAVTLAALLKRLNGPLDLGVQLAALIAVGMALTFGVINTMMGLGRVAWRYARPTYVFDLALSAGITTLLFEMLDLLWPHGRFFPPGTIIVAGLLAFLGFTAVRYRERLLTGLASRWLSGRTTNPIGERVLIVGAGECAALATWLLQHSNLGSAFSVIGMVDDDPMKQGMTVEGYRVHGLTHRIPELVEKQDVGLILFAIEKISPEERDRLLQLCRQTSARVVMVPDFMAMFRDMLRQPSEAAA